MKSRVFILRCVTNIHAGSGDSNYGVIDNQVQRDPVTGYPTIYSSGIKGAIREYVRDALNNKPEYSKEDYLAIFGSEPDRGNPDKSGTRRGLLKFTSAQLLAVPMRVSDGGVPYAMVTSKCALMSLMSFLDDANVSICKEIASKICELNPKNYYHCGDVNTVEGFELGDGVIDKDLQEYLNGILLKSLNKEEGTSSEIPLVIMRETDFDSKMKYLPVTARNRLKNGVSENLWYEEFVPHEAVFWYSVLCNEQNHDIEILNKLSQLITNGQMLQFGADASIGVGLVQISELKLGEN